MQLVYSNAQLVLVVNAQNTLQEAGIESQLKNEFLAGAAGDLSPFDTWPELWVSPADVDKASALIDAISSVQGSDWRCRECGEENGSAFEQCWKCSEERPDA